VLRSHEPAIRSAIEDTEAAVRGTIYRPFQLSSKQPLRATQHYLTKVPERIVGAVPALASALLMPAVSTVEEDHDPPLPDRAEDGLSLIGQDYVHADEAAASRERDPFRVDPTLVDRGVRGHAVTQNALAAWVRQCRHEPRSPKPNEPQYDLAWSDAGVVMVAEVKSLTAQNEERQLRLGLGQLLRYRQIMRSSLTEARAVLAVEREPADRSWLELCDALGVTLCWPPNFEGLEYVASVVVAGSGPPAAPGPEVEGVAGGPAEPASAAAGGALIL
jgi:transposase-like protein